MLPVQLEKLGRMLAEVRGGNPFYQRKWANISSGKLQDLPFTTRAELEEDQLRCPPFGTNLTYPLDRYRRYHQTSGSGASGRPMRWLDTAESWAWFRKLWAVIYGAAGVGSADRILFPFSFGPFVGFWAAFDGAAELGAMCMPAGGMSTEARLAMMIENGATVVCCTPTYALRMAEVAKQAGIDLPGTKVQKLIVAGEPGGSVAHVRERIEAAWGARVFDHHGMTEIGAVSFECRENRGTGVHVIESEFIAETIDPATTQPIEDGNVGELVVTNLGRWGSPLVRYRTGDLVRIKRGKCMCGREFARLEGGILGRIDDMFIVRGNNVHPAAVESVVLGVKEVAEFRCNIRETGALTQVTLEIEPAPTVTDPAAVAEMVKRKVSAAFSFRPDVVAVPAGSLPRFEMKARRFVRDRGEPLA